MRTYNRRFAEIARRRRKRRMLGKTNRARRCLIPGFKLHSSNPKLFVQGLAKWARVELGELISSKRVADTHRSADGNASVELGPEKIEECNSRNLVHEIRG